MELRHTQLLTALRVAGLKPRGYQMLGRYGVDADLPAQLTPQLQQLLAHYPLAAAADGSLRVEFTASQSARPN